MCPLTFVSVKKQKKHPQLLTKTDTTMKQRCAFLNMTLDPMQSKVKPCSEKLCCHHHKCVLQLLLLRHKRMEGGLQPQCIWHHYSHPARRLAVCITLYYCECVCISMKQPPHLSKDTSFPSSASSIKDENVTCRGSNDQRTVQNQQKLQVLILFIWSSR